MRRLKTSTTLFLLIAALAGVPGSSEEGAKAPGERPSLVLQVGHSGPISDVAFSPDATTLATASHDHTVRLWDARDGRLRQILKGHQAGVNAIAYSADGRWLATAGDDNRVRLWSAETGAPIASLEGHTAGVSAVAFSPDRTRLATASHDTSVHLWEIPSGKLTARLQGHRAQVISLAFSPDGQLLASGSYDRTVRVWDGRTGAERAVLRDFPYVGAPLAFSPDGALLAVASHGKEMKEPGEVRVWGVKDWTSQRALSFPAPLLYGLAFSPDGKSLAAGGGDDQKSGQARLWDVASGNVTAILAGHADYVNALAFRPDGRRLATGDRAGATRLWELKDGSLVSELAGKRTILALAFSADSQALATGDLGSTVRLWDAHTGGLKATLHQPLGAVTCYAYSPDGRTLATGSEDRMVRLWDARTGMLRATLQGPGWEQVFRVTFSPDGKSLAAGGLNDVRVWALPEAKEIATLQGHSGWIASLAFSPDGQTLVAGSGRFGESGEAHVWDLAKSVRRHVLRSPGHWVSALAFSPDGRTLAVGSGDGTARFWDWATGKENARFAAPTGHREDLSALAFAPDGLRLATAGRDRTVRLWNAPEAGSVGPAAEWHPAGELIWSGPGGLEPGRPVLAFSPDGKTVAITESGGKAKLWDVATRQPIPITPRTPLTGFPQGLLRPISLAGAAVSIHDPREGAVLATLVPVPDHAQRPEPGPPLRGGAPQSERGAISGEWFVTTPEGYFDCSANAARAISWSVNGRLYPAERFLDRFRRPDLVAQALRGEAVAAPPISARDIPPATRFVGLKNGDPVTGASVTVVVEATDDRAVRNVDLRVNGRPVPPGEARPIAADARPIPADARPIVADARPIAADARPIGADARPIAAVARTFDPLHRRVHRFTFRVTLPAEGGEVRLSALAHDDTGLASDPVEVVLRRTSAHASAGNLYALCVGVSRYKLGRDPGATTGAPIRNLRFPAADAHAVAARFRREGGPLYGKVEVRELIDDRATVANLRAGLKWLQASVRPGQRDTVLLYLSGHGVSSRGRYQFATHETDLKNMAATTMSGRELRQSLGGALRAKAVFLFVDTCHSGGLPGRTDDLGHEVAPSGVYMLASSGAREYSYESPAWQHGAFTLALLQALDRRELAADGVIHFSALTYAVPEGVASLIRETGRNESEQAPCIPRTAGPLRVPIAQVR